MTNSEILEDMRIALRDGLDGALTDDIVKSATKKLRDMADDVVNSLQYEIRDGMAEHLSYHVREMAGRAVAALLAGNEGEMIRSLSCDKSGYTGRSDGFNSGRSLFAQHPVIHGALFEQGCVALRKSIVEAHRDLITNERILDLEDQVKSLVEQVDKATREKEAMWQRVRDLEPAY